MLSKDYRDKNLISSHDDYCLEFIPSTQVNIEEVVIEEVIIEREIPTSEVDVTKIQYHVLSQTTPQTKTRVH